MNKVFLIGNITRDPESSETRSGTNVCHFSIAVNRSYTDANGDTAKQVSDVEDIVTQKPDVILMAPREYDGVGTAEAVERYCVKGSKVAVSGSIQIRNYEDNQGQKRTAVDVIVQDVEFLTPKEKRGSEDYYGGERGRGERTDRGGGKGGRKPALESFDDDGDIPF